MFKIAKRNLPELLKAIAAQQELYLPVNISGQTNFAVWTEETEADLDTLKTVKSPKDMFFPQSETLYTVRKDHKKLSIEPEALRSQKFVAFGMKACDIQGIKVLDKVFLAEPVDTFYRARREHGTIVTLACTQPEETCFCTAFGIDPAAPEGDARCWIEGDSLYMEALTEKGEKFLDSAASLTSECGDEAVRAQQEKTRDIAKKLPLHELNLTGFNGENMLKLFDSKKWGELSQACLGCGTCTFVCPTCQCYDIRDFNTGSGITRFRCWDSCMYSDFTKMASGNPRLTQLERFRQRFMHKLVYFPANNEGEYGCVGCGRCLAKCPISMNIVKVAKALAEEVR